MVIYTGIYPKLSLTALIHLPQFTGFNGNGIVLLLCIFETSVLNMTNVKTVI